MILNFLHNFSQIVLESLDLPPIDCHHYKGKPIFCKHGCEPGNIFKCDRCDRLVSWCNGGGEDNLCDRCYSEQLDSEDMEETETIIGLIQEFLATKYSGGLTGIGDLAEYCHRQNGELYSALKKMESQGEIKLLKKYCCPQNHEISPNAIADKDFYCFDCDRHYFNDLIDVAIYLEKPARKSCDR